MRQHLACPSYALITMVSILTVGLSVRSLCPDLSDPSSLTERTSDNQRLRTSNDTSVAKHPALKSQLDWGTDYSLASFLGRQIPVDESAARQLRDVNVALIAITRLQRIFNQWATIKLVNFTAPCSPRKMLRFDIWELAVRHFLPKLFTLDYLKCDLLNCLAGIRVRIQ